MKDRLLTVLLSVATTLTVMHFTHPSAPTVVVAADKPAVPPNRIKELTVDRLIVRHELIVSDTGKPWDDGFEAHQIPRGLVARSIGGGEPGGPAGGGTAGLWVRGRLIKTEIDDPFDDRFHAINRDGSPFRAPGHISWNIWLDGHWRQLAIIQGEALELSEVPRKEWTGGNHPGRLRFQSFRPHHPEPLTDAILGQGMMSIGGGGFGGGGLPYPSEVLQLWGGKGEFPPAAAPVAPRVTKDDGTGKHSYALIALGPQGRRSPTSATVDAKGIATLTWDSVNGADSYIVLRDGKEVTGPIRIEGSQKQWTDKGE